MIDENEFFRQAVMRICSSLQIEIAMQRCMDLLKDFMPAHEMYLHLYDIGLGALRTIAGATPTEGMKLDRITPLPPEVRAALTALPPTMSVINEPKENPVFQAMLKFYGRSDTSGLFLLLEVDGIPMGALALLAQGRERYTEEHGRLFSLLNQPFAVALSNTLKHQEVLRLKDILADDNRFLHREILHISGDEIVGADFGLKNVMTMVRHVAPLDSPVLLLGETGVGKDVIANAIHYSSSRKDGPFVKTNCGAIPETLIDSELFGYEKGAFTGALSQKRGRFERADQGTIFLDEIGELPLPAQVRMLRVLQYKEIERIGGSSPVSLNIRIISATNRNLEDMVATGRFREDLWFRLNVFPIRIPALRERKEDIPALIHYFVGRKSVDMKFRNAPSLAPGAIDPLLDYQWPGNVRELENVVERALILSGGQIPLSFEDLMGSKTNDERHRQPVQKTATPLTLDDAISRHIREALELTGGRVHGPGGAAEILDLHPSTLRNRMDQLGILYGRKWKKQKMD
jgi:formate hydrogenlyase transcriptional activator